MDVTFSRCNLFLIPAVIHAKSTRRFSRRFITFLVILFYKILRYEITFVIKVHNRENILYTSELDSIGLLATFVLSFVTAGKSFHPQHKKLTKQKKRTLEKLKQKVAENRDAAR